MLAKLSPGGGGERQPQVVAQVPLDPSSQAFEEKFNSIHLATLLVGIGTESKGRAVSSMRGQR